MVAKASTLIKVKAGTVRAGGVRGVEDSDSNNIIINSSPERTRSKELITHIKVSYI